MNLTDSSLTLRARGVVALLGQLIRNFQPPEECFSGIATVSPALQKKFGLLA